MDTTIRKLESFYNQVNTCNSLQDLHACLYLSERKGNNYFLHKANLENEIKKSISIDLMNYFICLINGINTTHEFYSISSYDITPYEIKPYDPIDQEDYTIQYLNINEIENFSILKNLLDVGTYNNDIKNIDVKEIKFYVFQVCFGENEILFFRNYRNPKILENNKAFRVINNTLSKITEKMFYIDDRSDLIFFDNYLFVLNRNSLNTIFNYKDNFIHNLSTALDTIKSKDIIQGFELFSEDCKTGIKTAQIFTRILRDKKDRFEYVINNFDKVPAVLDTLNIEYQFTDDNKFIYTGPECLDTLKTIFSDGFAQTMISQAYVAIKNDETIKFVWEHLFPKYKIMI